MSDRYTMKVVTLEDSRGGCATTVEVFDASSRHPLYRVEMAAGPGESTSRIYDLVVSALEARTNELNTLDRARQEERRILERAALELAT